MFHIQVGFGECCAQIKCVTSKAKKMRFHVGGGRCAVVRISQRAFTPRSAEIEKQKEHEEKVKEEVDVV